MRVAYRRRLGTEASDSVVESACSTMMTRPRSPRRTPSFSDGGQGAVSRRGSDPTNPASSVACVRCRASEACSSRAARDGRRSRVGLRSVSHERAICASEDSSCSRAACFSEESQPAYDLTQLSIAGSQLLMLSLVGSSSPSSVSLVGPRSAELLGQQLIQHHVIAVLRDLLERVEHSVGRGDEIGQLAARNLSVSGDDCAKTLPK